jgi:uncharacterized protein YeaO (DUF488 family)
MLDYLYGFYPFLKNNATENRYTKKPPPSNTPEHEETDIHEATTRLLAENPVINPQGVNTVNQYFSDFDNHIKSGNLSLARRALSELVQFLSGNESFIKKDLKKEINIKVEKLTHFLNTLDTIEKLKSNNQPENVLNKYETLLAEFPQYSFLRDEIIKIQEKIKITQQVISLIQSADKELLKSNLNLAIDFLERAIKIQPSDELRQKVEQVRNRIRQFEQLLDEADKALQNNNPEKALNLYENALKIQPSDELRQKVEQVRNRIRQFEQFLDEADKALQNNNPEKALNLYENALKIQPSDELRQKVEQVRNRIRQFEQFLDEADKALQNNNPEKALNLYENALKIQSSDSIRLKIRVIKKILNENKTQGSSADTPHDSVTLRSANVPAETKKKYPLYALYTFFLLSVLLILFKFLSSRASDKKNPHGISSSGPAFLFKIIHQKKFDFYFKDLIPLNDSSFLIYYNKDTNMIFEFLNSDFNTIDMKKFILKKNEVNTYSINKVMVSNDMNDQYYILSGFKNDGSESFVCITDKYFNTPSASNLYFKNNVIFYDIKSFKKNKTLILCGHAVGNDETLKPVSYYLSPSNKVFFEMFRTQEQGILKKILNKDDDTLYFIGYCNVKDNDSATQAIIFKYNFGTNRKMEFKFGSGHTKDEFSDITSCENGNIICVGGEDGWIIKFDSQLNMMWEHVYGKNTDFCKFTAVHNISDSIFLVCGYQDKKNKFPWLCILDHNGYIKKDTLLKNLNGVPVVYPLASSANKFICLISSKDRKQTTLMILQVN